MKNKKKILLIISLTIMGVGNFLGLSAENFPDGSPISAWFHENKPTEISKLGKKYIITDYGVLNDSTKLQTRQIQTIIDRAHNEGGGVIVIPQGTFLSGSLFFKQGTHLHLEEGSVIKGSDDISHFKLLPSRMEGQNLKYFSALINVDGLDGFTISGKGTLNGNGLRYWRSFWLRREYNPNCTNLEEMRPRILFVSNSKNIQISGIRMVNSPFWTSHYYKCENVKLIDLYIYAPKSPVKAPSSDAVDLDACKNVLIKNCYMSVNDDAVALKGGKGPSADKDELNGGNYNIIIEDCEYGFCHSALTCGSESIHNRNIILRRTKVNNAQRLLHLKMRPDTPQNYEYILIENISGSVSNMLYVNPWTQFFDLKGQPQPYSSASNIIMRNINLRSNTAFQVKNSDQYSLSNFTFEDIIISTKKIEEPKLDFIKGMVWKNVKITNE